LSILETPFSFPLLSSERLGRGVMLKHDTLILKGEGIRGFGSDPQERGNRRPDSMALKGVEING
jgi:hypothetical protein